MKNVIRNWVLLMSVLGLAASAQAADVSDDVVVNAFQRDQIRSQIDQVRSYRGALKSLTEDRRFATQAKAVEVKIDALLRRAEQLMTETRLNEAVAAANEANRLVIETLTRMRSGDTVVVSLSFENPAQEFAYEVRRFESSEIMIAMALEDGKAGASVSRKSIDAQLKEARRQRQISEREAGLDKHADAVQLMEGANRQLNRVLQELGVPVF